MPRYRIESTQSVSGGPGHHFGDFEAESPAHAMRLCAGADYDGEDLWANGARHAASDILVTELLSVSVTLEATVPAGCYEAMGPAAYAEFIGWVDKAVSEAETRRR